MYMATWLHVCTGHVGTQHNTDSKTHWQSLLAGRGGSQHSDTQTKQDSQDQSSTVQSSHWQGAWLIVCSLADYLLAGRPQENSVLILSCVGALDIAQWRVGVDDTSITQAPEGHQVSGLRRGKRRHARQDI